MGDGRLHFGPPRGYRGHVPRDWWSPRSSLAGRESGGTEMHADINAGLTASHDVSRRTACGPADDVRACAAALMVRCLLLAVALACAALNAQIASAAPIEIL